MLGKMNNIIRIPTSLNTNFFKYWLEFLKPFHNLTDREIQVAAYILKKRYELSKVVKDESILNKVVLGEDTKKALREDCNLSLSHFQVIIGKLKKSKFLLDSTTINPRFLPNIEEGQNSFRLLLNFEFSDK